MTELWKWKWGKYLPFNENADHELIKGCECYISEEDNLILVTGVCPFCGGFIGVDQTYLLQGDHFIHCPICCMEIFVNCFKDDWCEEE